MTLLRPRFLIPLALLLLALIALGLQGFDGEDEDDQGPSLRSALWSPVLQLTPVASVENLFSEMGRTDGLDGRCGQPDALPVLDAPLPEPGSWACVRIENMGAEAGIWRIDFEGAFAAGYRFETLDRDKRTVVLANPGLEAWRVGDVISAGRNVASRPIVVAAGASVDLYLRIDSPSDLEDADPVLKPEAAFVQSRTGEAFGFATLFGAAALLLLLVLSMSRLLRSRPAAVFAIYFTAAMLSAVATAGFLSGLFAGNATLPVGLLNKLFEAVQIVAHLVFMATFLEAEHPASRWAQGLRRVALFAAAVLLLAGIAGVTLGGSAGALLYVDLGFELDPLLGSPFASVPTYTGALITATWLLAIAATSLDVLRRDQAGSTLFACGGMILIAGLLASSFAEDALPLISDTAYGLQYFVLADALIFVAAMARQTFGIRDQRDTAIRQELKTAREKQALAESLLEARQDVDRSKALAEQHRSRLALTGHDLRQPLTSLHLALTEAERTNPTLGASLRSSLDYIRAVLNETIEDTTPEDVSEDEGAYHTDVPETEALAVDLLFENAVRMFAKEADAKGLALTYDRVDAQVVTNPVALIRILSNLVSNAVKYTHTGEVTLRARFQAETVALEVADTGPGMTADEVAAIKRAYTRGSQAHAADGDGLGLSSAQTLAADLGLALTVESTPGKGSVFRIEGLTLA